MNVRLKKLFCRHDYHKVDWEMAMDYRRNEVYSVRTYVCDEGQVRARRWLTKEGFEHWYEAHCSKCIYEHEIFMYGEVDL